jgi:hypothetical protein
MRLGRDHGDDAQARNALRDDVPRLPVPLREREQTERFPVGDKSEMKHRCGSSQRDQNAVNPPPPPGRSKPTYPEGVRTRHMIMSSIRGALVPVFALYFVATFVGLTLTRWVGGLAVMARRLAGGVSPGAALAGAE